MARRARSYERALLIRFSLIGLGITVIMAAALGYAVQRHLTESALKASVDLAVRQVTIAIGPDISAADLENGLDSETRSHLDRAVVDELSPGGVVRVKLWNRDGVVVYSDLDAAIGTRDTDDPPVARALAGMTVTEVSNLDEAENGTERGWGRLLEVYVPVRLAGSDQVVGAYEIYQTTKALDASIARIRVVTAVGVFGGFAVLYVALFGIVLGASRRLFEHSRANERMTAEVVNAYDQTIEGWARALDLKDHETEGHSRRVTGLAVEIAEEMGMSPDEIVHLRRGALLHDIGKMGVPDEILNKPGKLTPEEWDTMKAHPVYAREMLQGVAYLGPALDVPVHHHERWDGTGYPDGLAGEQIPLSARVFACADVWDALSSDRPYRKAWTMDQVAAHMEEGAGTHFDPRAVAALVSVMRSQAEALDASTASTELAPVYDLERVIPDVVGPAVPRPRERVRLRPARLNQPAHVDGLPSEVA